MHVFISDDCGNKKEKKCYSINIFLQRAHIGPEGLNPWFKDYKSHNLRRRHHNHADSFSKIYVGMKKIF